MRVDINEFVDLLRVNADVIVTAGTEFDTQATDRVRLNFSQDHTKAVDAIRRMVEVATRLRKQ